MIIKKSEFLKELVNKELNIIGNNDDVETPEEVTSNSTTDSHIDATTQQMGKNRTNAVYSVNLMNTGVLPVLEEYELVEAIERIKNTLTEELHNTNTSEQGIPDINTLKEHYPIIGRNLEILSESIKNRGIDEISGAIILNTIANIINIQQLPENYKEILRNKLV